MFRLAGDLGMTVGELGERMSGVELMEWAAWYDIQQNRGVVQFDKLEGAELKSARDAFHNYVGGVQSDA